MTLFPKPSHLFSLALALQLISSPLHANISLPHLFSDHMVLQQASKVPVWGRAEPGETIRIEIAGCKAETQTDSSGKWKLNLDLSKIVEPGPFVFVVEGKNRIEVKDVLVGEVWLASGQSNMEFPLNRAIGAEQEIAGGTNSQLRQFIVPRNHVPQPLEDCPGRWVVYGRDTAAQFSAVGYFFAKKLQLTLKKPIGLIFAALGSTPVEAWTSYQALAENPELKAATDHDIEASERYPNLKTQYVEAMRAWQKRYAREDRPDANTEAIFANFKDKTGWAQVTLPGEIAAAGLPEAGAVWLVRTFDYSPDKAGKGIQWSVGSPMGFEAFYFNGQKIGERTLDTFRGQTEGRVYNIPGNLVKAGQNIAAIRVFNPIGHLGVSGKVFQAGPWAAKMEFTLPAMTEQAAQEVPTTLEVPPDPKKVGGSLFNGMIYPLIPCAIRGAIWYQGENNTERAYQYREAFPILIQDWRKRWGEGDFPFYFCQLANHHRKEEKPGDDAWAELREAQSMTLRLPNTGQAVLIDVGEAGDIHPRDKKSAGDRLAAIALANTYKQTVPYSGPVYQSQAIEGGSIRIRFTHTEGGLAATPLPATHWLESASNRTLPLVRNSPNSPLEGFAICGGDKQWLWADAIIDKDTVVVSCATVANPIAVRYGWAKNPTCNLTNGSGLPAAPFRTDDFPAITKGK